MAGFGGSFVLKLVSGIILTRLIHPEVYGVMDLVTAVLIGLQLFSDIGTPTCIVQSPRGDDRRFLNTAWSLEIVRGTLLTLVAFAIALPVASIYERPILAYAIPVAGLTALIDSAKSSHLFVLNRSLQRGWVVALEFGSAVVNLVVTVSVVYIMHPAAVAAVAQGGLSALPVDERLVWAIVAGGLASRLSRSVSSHFLPGAERARFEWDRDAVKEILSFGKWIFLSTILAYAAAQADRLMVPKLLSFEAAGIYGRALGLAYIGVGVMDALARHVVYPVYSKMFREGRLVHQRYIKVYAPVAAFGSLLVTGMITVGNAASKALYPSAYDDVGWILQLLAIGVWLKMLQANSQSVLLASGRRQAFTVPTATKLVGLAIFVPIGWFTAQKLGFNALSGLILGFASAEALAYLAVVLLVRRHGVSSWRIDALLAVCVAGSSWLAARWGNDLCELMGVGAPSSRGEWVIQVLVRGGIAVALWGGIAGLLNSFGVLQLGVLLKRPKRA